MKNKIIYIVCVASIYILMVMGTRPTISLFAHELGASVNHIGFITSLFSLIPLLFAILLGKRIDRLNSKVTLLFGSYLGIIGIILPSFYPSFIGLYISQLIAGSAHTIFILSAQDYIGRISTKETRNQYVSWFSFGVAVGTLLGPLIGGIISDILGFPKTFFIMAVIGLLSSIIVHFIPNEYPVGSSASPSSETANQNSFFDLLKIPSLRLALLLSALILFAKDIYLTFFPLLGLQFGYSNSTIGILLAVNGIASIIIRFYLLPLTKRFGNIKCFIGSMLLSIISFIALPFFSEIVIASIIAFALGIGLGIGQPLSISLTIANALNGRVAEALGIRLTVNRLTQFSTPIIFGLLANLLGLIHIFLVSSAVIAAGTAVANRNQTITKTNKPISHRST